MYRMLWRCLLGGGARESQAVDSDCSVGEQEQCVCGDEALSAKVPFCSPSRAASFFPRALQLAFAHFRFEVEADEPTLYVYDIQISPQAQRRGLGRFLMQLIELIAWRVGMTNVMLTVFEGNQGGRRLYEALGYVKSIDSPDYGVERSDKGYSILRKQKPVPRNKA